MVANDTHIRVAAWEERSVVNGPGEHFVLWVQGCPILCAGCVNAAYLPESGGERLPVAWLLERILRTPRIEGVTFSGGEPTAQAGNLALLAEGVRAAGLSVLCYTGYYLSDLRTRKDAAIDQLLNAVDVLIDGPFIAAQQSNLPWRGSANQTVHFLSSRYQHCATFAAEPAARAGIHYRPGRIQSDRCVARELATAFSRTFERGLKVDVPRRSFDHDSR